MARITKADWIEDVLKFINDASRYKKLTKRATRLLSQYSEFEKIAELKRRSAERRKLINNISGKEKISVSAEKYSKLKEYIQEANDLIEK